MNTRYGNTRETLKQKPKHGMKLGKNTQTRSKFKAPVEKLAQNLDDTKHC